MIEKYYIYYPNNFSNEFSIFYVSNNTEQSMIDELIDVIGLNGSCEETTLDDIERKKKWCDAEKLWGTEIFGSLDPLSPIDYFNKDDENRYNPQCWWFKYLN